MLEILHPEDSKLLLAIKDGKWPYSKITKDVVNQILPGMLDMHLQADGTKTFA
jgi:hypothetical protein